MASQQFVPDARPYRICSYSLSNPHEDSAWFSLGLRLHGKEFSITVLESQFRNSPNRLREFLKYHAYLTSHEDTSEGEDDACTAESNDVGGGQDMTIDDCFAWAVQPFIVLFNEIAPKPSPTLEITLDDYFNYDSYCCHLRATYDSLEPGPVELLETIPSFIPEEYETESSNQENPEVSALFPTFPLSVIEIVSDRPEDKFDEEPRLVRVQGSEYFFKSFEALGEDIGRSEIRKYEEMAKANLSPESHISRLFGIAQDDQGKVVGIMLHRIHHENTTLEDVILTTTPESTRKRWRDQIRQSLEALHAAGIAWGDARAGNVIVDVQGDAWITNFAGGYTKGWVDKDRTGAIASDIQGFSRIEELLTTRGGALV
ncbi:hypothetical protein NLG97_g705 [Lecanicillium saksenae]|uniref:Uncharacterized protein n=1 Tax=Lecanicillium saksenae TaxID=468837 RepID=A0ACC1R9Y4_9HYPO|nr:hypothetical protein NLG97_g705 [Lecanicillium saksenae]